MEKQNTEQVLWLKIKSSTPSPSWNTKRQKLGPSTRSCSPSFGLSPVIPTLSTMALLPPYSPHLLARPQPSRSLSGFLAQLLSRGCRSALCGPDILPRTQPSWSRLRTTSTAPLLDPGRELPPPNPSARLTPPPRLSQTASLLPLLCAQPHLYFQVHIHGRPYLTTLGDTIRLPFLMPGVQPGDRLRLNRVSLIASRDYALLTSGSGHANKDNKDYKNNITSTPSSTQQIQTALTGSDAPPSCSAPPPELLLPGVRAVHEQRSRYLDERYFTCRATVLGTEAEPMRLIRKTRPRRRRVKTVRSKHRYTILRISDLTVHPQTPAPPIHTHSSPLSSTIPSSPLSTP